MFLSTSKKFIFFHNYKVAGTCIRSALKEHESVPYYYLSRFIQEVGLSNFKNLGLFSSNISAGIAKKYLPTVIFENYFKFELCRNPWGWQVSLYFYMLKNKNHRQHEKKSL